MLDRETLQAVRSAVRSTLEDRADSGADAALADLDVFGLLAVGPTHDVAAGLRDAVVVLEELGRAAGPAWYPDTAVAGTIALREAGGTSLMTLAVEVAAGQQLIAHATTDLGGTGLTRGRADAGLSGSVTALGPRTPPHLLLCEVVDGHDISLALVQAADPRVSHRRVETTGRSILHRFELTGVTPFVEPLRAADGTTGRLVDDVHDSAAIGASARLVGAIDRCLELTLDHARTRHQSGHPIGSYQAVQTHCVDIAIALDSARAITRRAALAFDEEAPQRHRLASSAKAWTTEAYGDVVRLAHRVHGALGFTEEYALARHSREESVLRLAHGAPATHRRRIAQTL